MVRGRRIPVLVGTIALLAGCGTQSRVEVSGVVRDRVTGRAIAGALVVAADGSSTRTDGEGRFVLSVLRTEHHRIRASAVAHADAIGWIEGGEPIALELAPSIEDDDPDAVLRWLRESWLEESWSADRVRSLEEGAFLDPESDEIAAAHASDHGTLDDASCSDCHEAEAAVIELGTGDAPPPHATLAGECTACHGARAAGSVVMRVSLEADLEPARCAACHGEGARVVEATRLAAASLAASRSHAERSFAGRVSSVERCGRAAAAADRIDGAVLLVDARGFVLGDCDASGAIDGREIAVGLEVLSPEVANLAEDLALLRSDRSLGVHQPRYALELARRISDAH